MKKILLFIGVLLILFSCKKEKFNLGIYKIEYNWTQETENGKEDFESTAHFIEIISETETVMEIQGIYGGVNYSSTFLDKKRSKISGGLPVGPGNPIIEGKKVLFGDNISGTFISQIYSSQGLTQPPIITNVKGKFKMVKQ